MCTTTVGKHFTVWQISQDRARTTSARAPRNAHSWYSEVRIRQWTTAHGALPPGPLLSSGGGHKWQISATTRDTAMTPANASMLIRTKRVIPLMVPHARPRRRNNAVALPNFSAIALMELLWIAGLAALPPCPSHTRLDCARQA